MSIHYPTMKPDNLSLTMSSNSYWSWTRVDLGTVHHFTKQCLIFYKPKFSRSKTRIQLMQKHCIILHVNTMFR